jgi:peroxiredoxin
MALKESNMLALGTKAPEFSLPDTVSGKQMSFRNVEGPMGTVVMFICNHCPYVIHVNPEVTRLANDYLPRGFGFVAISSNDVEKYPQDGPDEMKTFAAQNGYTFPYLYDETQEVAEAYDAACTPDFYIFDNQQNLVYRGRLDDSRPGNGIPLSGNDLRAALDDLISGKPVSDIQYPSAGCSLKWKPGKGPNA